jgi:anti-anti-sigma factor
MVEEPVSIIKIYDVLIVTMPADADDATITALQAQVLRAVERHVPKGLVLDVSAVAALDSFFARTILETASMVALMGGRTVLVGVRPSVAIAAIQLGLSFKFSKVRFAVNVERALEILREEASQWQKP